MLDNIINLRNTDISILDLPLTKENQLRKKEINTVDELLSYTPKEYIDYSKPILSNELQAHDGEEVALVGKFKSYYEGKGMFTAVFKDSAGYFEVTLFGQDYMKKLLFPEKDYIICGKVKYNYYTRKYMISGPRYVSDKIYAFQRLVPRYVKIRGMSEEYLMNTINKAVDHHTENVIDVDNTFLINLDTIPIVDAVREIHYPRHEEPLKEAKKRLVIDRLFKFLWLSEGEKRQKKTSVKVQNTSIEKFLKEIPFDLTNDQLRAINKLREDMDDGNRIDALVQGDVGCGKTIVAFLLMSIMAENSYQSVLIAPTQTLAIQHFNELHEFGLSLGFKTALLTGSTKVRERRKILEGLKSGEIDFLVSTHAGFSDDVEYNNLGLKIIDEEHKFGVNQREKLHKRYKDIHSVSMSATPIPRSLAKIAYGDEVNIINILEMPKGRVPIKTALEYSHIRAFNMILHEKEKGHQSYVVCPLIEEGKIEATTVMEAKKLLDSFVKGKNKNLTTAVIHGGMKKTEIEEIVNNFKAGKIDTLISTTIVEVGVNVPNATVMVILNAERFGLSSLHQLRGRVGRSKYDSYCILVSEETEKERLKIMTTTNDGFEIAKADLEIRGPGDIIGTRQSGDSIDLDLVMSYPVLVEKIKDEIKNIKKDKYRLKFYEEEYFEN